MSEKELQRNESGQILDHRGYPLELSAEYDMAAVHGTGRAEQAAKAAFDEAMAKDPAANESYDLGRAYRDAQTAHKAARWDNYDHYNRNRNAYYDAASREDERRTLQKAGHFAAGLKTRLEHSGVGEAAARAYRNAWVRFSGKSEPIPDDAQVDWFAVPRLEFPGRVDVYSRVDGGQWGMADLRIGESRREGEAHGTPSISIISGPNIGLEPEQVDKFRMAVQASVEHHREGAQVLEGLVETEPDFEPYYARITDKDVARAGEHYHGTMSDHEAAARALAHQEHIDKIYAAVTREKNHQEQLTGKGQ